MQHRQSGILLHPTSLPGGHGIGTLGPAARAFVDFLADAGQTLWQVLPLGPTGYGDSPYSSFSSFAGNPLLISLSLLQRDGWLVEADLEQRPDFPAGRVDYGAVIPWKQPLVRKAAQAFIEHAPRERREAFFYFCQEESWWLDDYVLFMALKEHFDAQAHAKGEPGGMWSTHWDLDIRTRQPEALERWRSRLQPACQQHQVLQFFFFEQWRGLRAYAHERGITIVGDLPIFVAPDSADVWAAPDNFLLDEQARQTHVAGVPPDYFSATGQRWGNPLYRWETMARTNYRWWVNRLRATLRLVDAVRIDHFRGFEAYWAIPAEEETAQRGEWVPAPGWELFEAIRQALPDAPILAEDLGVITDQVRALRNHFNLPGMILLQTGFNPEDHRDPNFLPHNHTRDMVVYPGTHDNDTTVGWYEQLGPEERAFLMDYVGHGVPEIHWELIRLAMASVAQWAIMPMQDVLGLDSEARMNRPSVPGGNWSWRCPADYASRGAGPRLLRLAEMYGRIPGR